MRYIRALPIFICLLVFTGCTRLADILTKPTETVTVTQGDLLINIRMGKAYVYEYIWDGDVSDTSITIPDTVIHPDTGREVPVTALGGVYGMGVPMPFTINDDDCVYSPEEGAEITPVTFHMTLGRNITDHLHCAQGYHIKVADGDSFIYYKPDLFIDCSEDNTAYYSKDGRLYSRSDDTLIEDLPYRNDADEESTSSVSEVHTAEQSVTDTEASDTVSEMDVTTVSVTASDTSSDDDMPDAYKELLSLYLYVQENRLDNLDTADAGLDTALTAYGWPFAVSDETIAGFFLYDIDNSGTPELFITLDSSIMDIWSYDGQKAVHAYSCPYRGSISVLEDGYMTELFGTMRAASTALFRFDPVTGRALPVVQHAYDPSSDDEESAEYHIFACEYDRERLEAEYAETGVFPEWAYQWKDITSEEYESRLTDAKEASLPEPVPIISLKD